MNNVLIHPLHRASICARCGLVGEIYCGQILLCVRCAEEIGQQTAPVQIEPQEPPKGPSLLETIETLRGRT